MEEEILSLVQKDNWNQAYRELCVISELSNNSTTLSASSEENRNFNRYLDVYPYDHSRVILKGLSSGVDYINASHVRNQRAQRDYILAQGPLEQTLGHFWYLVWQEKCGAILMLNRLIEKGTKKCEKYWPDEKRNVLTFREEGLKVEFVQTQEGSDYTLRKLKLTNTKSEETREILHFQYTTWPDFGVPRCPDKFLEFLEAVRKTGNLDTSSGPPVIHCSAGIGRSGTFCLVDTALVLIDKEGPESVILKDILLDLRRYRMGLIQTYEQMKFSYLAVYEWAKRNHHISSNISIDSIGSSYNSNSTGFHHDHSSDSDNDNGPPPLPPRSESLTKTPDKINEEGLSSYSPSSIVSKTESSQKSTILNNHKMEERKREVQEHRKREKEEKREETQNKIKEMKRKQREAEKKRTESDKNYVPFYVGLLMVLSGVAFYYYYGKSH